MPLAIADITYSLPARVVTNDDLAVEQPTWDMARVASRTGVLRRHIAEDETAFDLACRAASELMSRNPSAKDVDAILFCTQTPDQVMPPNSALLHEYLGLKDQVFALPSLQIITGSQTCLSRTNNDSLYLFHFAP